MKPLATLSLDLDNQWAYLRTQGHADWKELPSYLDRLLPRLLDFLAEHGLELTFFVVGQDAALERHRQLFADLGQSGHEVGNHSYRHEPWLHHYTTEELHAELARSERAIESATGVRTQGFRGPGYSLSAATVRVLSERGYRYDATTLPSFLGPLARFYFMRRARLDADQKDKRGKLFGGFREGLRPLRPYRWRADDDHLVVLPITTMPFTRTPIHISYVLYLAAYSRRLALSYFDLALRLCRARRIEPSILLHPLDFLSGDDPGLESLSFFPAMRRPHRWKLDLVGLLMTKLTRDFTAMPLGRYLDQLESRAELHSLPLREFSD